MEKCIKVFLIITYITRCAGVSWRRQLEHIANAKKISHGLPVYNIQSRRFYEFDPRELSNVLGVPSRPSHLPEAEPVLPGHTLLKPTLGMLKSAVKFPHKELEGGAGVYGHIDNLGIRYDGRNERTLYTGFRRSPSDYIMVAGLIELYPVLEIDVIIKATPTPEIFRTILDSQVIPNSRYSYGKPRFQLTSAVLDLERKEEAKNALLKILKRLNIPLKGVNFFVAPFGGHGSSNVDNMSLSYYLSERVEPSNSFDANKMILRDTKSQNQPDVSASSKEHAVSKEQIIEKNSKELEMIKKFEWLLQSKNSFNHIKVNQDAPDINELLPALDGESIQEWWYYNADDYKPFP